MDDSKYTYLSEDAKNLARRIAKWAQESNESLNFYFTWRSDQGSQYSEVHTHGVSIKFDGPEVPLLQRLASAGLLSLYSPKARRMDITIHEALLRAVDNDFSERIDNHIVAQFDIRDSIVSVGGKINIYISDLEQQLIELGLMDEELASLLKKYEESQEKEDLKSIIMSALEKVIDKMKVGGDWAAMLGGVYQFAEIALKLL